MPEYIEVETAVDFVKNNTPCFGDETSMRCVERSIRNAPTADVVEVVRCKDCEHYIEYPLSKRAKEIAPWSKCNKNKHLVYPTDFCGYGERKEVKDA